MSARKSIVVPQIAHKFPVPNASRIGNFVVSGSISGVDPVSHEMPEGLTEQCAHMFANMKSVIEAAGGTTGDIIKMTVFIRDRNNRGPLNDEWVRMFPDAESRPARHAQLLAIEGPSLIQCDFMAVIAER
jgi:2-iminobutanoate/2-iminopropanoate deaminase